LRQFSDDMSRAFFRFRVVVAKQSYGRRDRHAEHVAIFQAAIDGRADDAVALLAEHHAHTSSLVTRLVQQRARLRAGVPGWLARHPF
jgi:GntR family transcriptional regulator, carbon starvation induced regulator